MTTTATFGCPRCGNALFYGQLACNRCGALVYSDRLNQLSSEAMRIEHSDPRMGSVLWRQCLDLLPGDARQAEMIRARIHALESGQSVEDFAPHQPAIPKNDTWATALVKTGGSMLISLLVYALIVAKAHGMTYGLLFATGFVLLILVHELGHSLAMKYYGLSAGPPIFIPFMGALINLRQPPRNAWEEAVVGIGGPVMGTVGAIACHAAYLITGADILLELACFGYLLNLLNLLPVPPLDGGRITAAVSPWIWMPGLLALVWMIVSQWQATGRPSFLLILLLFFAWPRIVQTLKRRRRGEANPYYDIGKRKAWTMGTAYFGLGIALIALFYVTRMGLIAMGMGPMV